MSLYPLLRSLAHRNYRLYFLGQGISLIGTWMQQVAISWLVYEMTGSSFELGIVLFAGQCPAVFLSSVAGVLADHWNRYRVLLVTQSVAMAQAFALAILAWTGQIEIWQLIVLNLFLGVAIVVDMTTRQAFLSEIVDNREHLSNAIALNSTIFTGARLVGPMIAGFILAHTTAGVCFFLNGLSYGAVLLALGAMRLDQPIRERPKESLWEAIREGFRYVRRFMPIRSLLFLLGVTSMVGASYPVLLPEFTVRQLGGDARALGLLTAAAGLGALVGALLLASRQSVPGLDRWVVTAATLLGLGLLAFGLINSLMLALIVLMVIGFGVMVEMAGTNTLLQSIAVARMRGRVLSFYALASLGMVPLGSLLTGALSSRLGLPTTLWINGLLCLTGVLFFAVRWPRWRRVVEPIYVRQQVGLRPGDTTVSDAAAKQGPDDHSSRLV